MRILRSIGRVRFGRSDRGGRAQWRRVQPSVENLVAQLTDCRGSAPGRRSGSRSTSSSGRPRSARARLGAGGVKERVRFCRECGNLTEDETCAICLDTRRDHTTICVVEQLSTVVSLERTNEYRGLYPRPRRRAQPDRRRRPEPPAHSTSSSAAPRRTASSRWCSRRNPTMTGEATAAYLADRLRDRVRVTRSRAGCRSGGDLEYADEVTLGRALSGRREMP